MLSETCACLSSSGRGRGGQRPAKATAATSSIYYSHTSTRKHDRPRAVILNSARFQPSRGALIHRCVRVHVVCFISIIITVSLTSQPRSHVAVQPSSVAPPLAPSSFFVCSQNLVSLDLDPQSPGWHTWVRKVSEHNTTTLHTFSIVFLCSSCWRCFALTPFARVLMFAFCSNVFVLSSVIF